MILAGGFGTRLRPLTYSRPKSILPVGPKPVLQYLIESLSKQGFDEIVITANYLREQIENYFGNGSKFGVSLRYPREESPLGTAGSVKNAEKYLDETFAVIQGDSVTDINLAEQLAYHREKRSLVTLGVVPVEKPWRYGVVELDEENKVIDFKEKPSPKECQSNLANTGMYFLEPDVLNLIPRNKPFDFANDVFPLIIETGIPLYGFRAAGFWTDIGTVEGFLEASAWLLDKLGHSISRTADVNRATIKGPVWIGDGTILETDVRIQGPAFIEDSCTIGKGTQITPGTMLKRRVNVGENSRLDSAIVFGSTEIHTRVSLSKCILDERCKIGSNTEIDSSAIIGAGCTLGENVVIGPGVRLEPGLTVEQGKVIRT
ncbi:MAG: NDP-sugar synthase [Candidatus Atabeyarchaeum deiterrae]